MSMMKRATLLALLVGLVAAGCQEAPAPPAAPEPAADRSAELAAMANRCGLPPSTLRVVERQQEKQLLFTPAPDTEYGRVECVLQQIQRLEPPLPLMGFVGNEQPAPDRK